MLKRLKHVMLGKLKSVLIIFIISLFILLFLNFLGYGGLGMIIFVTTIVVYSFINSIGFIIHKGEISVFLLSIFLTIVFTIILFAFLFTIPFSNNCIKVDGNPKNLTFHEGLYFSTSTFTTLGYGDFVPYGFHYRTLSIIESFLGFIYLGVFVSGFILLREK